MVNSIALDNNWILLWENTLNQTAAASSNVTFQKLQKAAFFTSLLGYIDHRIVDSSHISRKKVYVKYSILNVSFLVTLLYSKGYDIRQFLF